MSIPENELRRRYVDEGQTVQKIAEDYGYESHTIVYHYLDKYDIPRRGGNTDKYDWPPDDRLLELVEENSYADIAEMINGQEGPTRQSVHDRVKRIRDKEV